MREPEADLPNEAVLALQRGRKIEAIKCVRLALGVDLKEAKRIVEEFINRSPEVQSRMRAAHARSAAGASRWLALLAALALAAYYLLGRAP